MTKNIFSVKIANDTVRKRIFAEISQEGEYPLLTIFPPLQGNYWEFPLDEALAAIENAKNSLA